MDAGGSLITWNRDITDVQLIGRCCIAMKARSPRWLPVKEKRWYQHCRLFECLVGEGVHICNGE